jgi:hypothetical protein
VVLARHIMALDRLGERMVDLEGKVALMPINTKMVTPDIEEASEPDADEEEAVLAEAERDESKAVLAEPESEERRGFLSQPKSEERRVVLARHIMALDRLGERMVDLEGKVALLPAKKSTQGTANAASEDRQMEVTVAPADVGNKKLSVTMSPSKDQLVRTKQVLEMTAARDQAQLERRRAAERRKKERESNPNWREEMVSQREKEKIRKIEERNLQKQQRRQDHERREKRQGEKNIIEAQLRGVFDMDVSSVLARYVHK